MQDAVVVIIRSAHISLPKTITTNHQYHDRNADADDGHCPKAPCICIGVLIKLNRVWGYIIGILYYTDYTDIISNFH